MSRDEMTQRHSRARRHDCSGLVNARGGRGLIAAIVLGLAALSACALRQIGADQAELRPALQALEAAAAAGKTGTITGNLYLLNPGVPTLLRDHPVTVVPLTPRLEQAIAEIGRRYATTHDPFPPAEAARAKQLLDDAVGAIKRLGGEAWIRTTRTEQDEAGFRFDQVPEGRWLLVAEFETRHSRLLWAVPVSVEAGTTTLKRLNDGNIWLDGLKPAS